ncbi:MAG: nitrophenyl compound nitroreductase subunit ArsF family protein [Bacteroidales bacterium]
MKNIVYMLWALVALMACSQQQGTEQSKIQLAKDGVEVLYFHGKKRCITCNAIEKLTKEVIENDFAEALQNGSLRLKIIDIASKNGEQIADKYEVSWSSIYINKWENGKELRCNMTDFGFSYAKDAPEVFKAGIKKKIKELLKPQ